MTFVLGKLHLGIQTPFEIYCILLGLKTLHNPENRGCGDCLCIMVAHALYVCVSLLACAFEVTPGSIAAIAGYIAGRTATEGEERCEKITSFFFFLLFLQA